MQLNNATVFVVDTYGILYQNFHSLPEMKGKDGEDVNAVYGVMRDMMTVLEKLNPSYLFFAFDLHGPTFRHEMYHEYKIQREKMPDELISQVPRIRAILEEIGIPVLGKEGFEADDVLATVARMTEEAGGQCVLVTSDKDARQLISDSTKIYSLRRGIYLDRDFLLDDWGIAPEQVVDYQALVGDSSDNIPGIALIGPKIATELLKEFGSLDEILKPENLERYFGTKPSKRKTNLLMGTETAHLCRELVRLRRDVPITLDWTLGDVTRFDLTRALPTLRQYLFNSLVPKFEKFEKFVPQSGADVPREKPEIVESVPLEIETEFEFPHFPGRFCPENVETGRESVLVLPPGLFSDENPTTPAGNDLFAMFEDTDPIEDFIQEHGAELENPRVQKVGFDLKTAYKVLKNQGVTLVGELFDVQLAAYMLHSGEELDTLEKVCGLFADELASVIPAGTKLPTDTKPESLEIQTKVLCTLFDCQRKKLAGLGLDRIAYDLEFPLLLVLAEMERAGVYVDTGRLKKIHGRFSVKIDALVQELYALAGEPENSRLNLNSPKQLQVILFERLGLTPVRKTKTGASTDAQTLEELSVVHEFPAKLLEYRQLVKLQNTYVEALPKLISDRDGRIHTTFNQAVTATGRLSSSEPNLQNIPVRSEEGRLIRSAFLPRPAGWRFVSADYSQIELRVLAHFCRDKNLMDAFLTGEDVHTRVAGQVYGIPTEQVTKEMRRVAKTVNFGLIYGQSAFGLARQLRIPQAAARHFIDEYFEQFPTVQAFLNTVLDFAKENGYVSTLFGRRRMISDEIRRDRAGQLNQAGRMAVNTVIQGTAADLIKLAMCRVSERLKREKLGSRMLIQIHDELLLEVPPTELERVENLLREEMTSTWRLRVPLAVDVEVTEEW